MSTPASAALVPRPATRWFDGPAGRLDGRLHGPPAGRPVLLLHPHPRYGGTMGTRFVYRLAQALADEGYRAVRFDFRGAGRSDGSYDRGVGETQDALAVWDAVRDETDQAPAVVGFSFGAGVAVRLAGRRDVPAVVLVAPPARVRDSELDLVADAASVRCCAHVVIGTEDRQVDPRDADRVRAALPDARITVLQGADHFLTPTHHDRGVAATVSALRALL